MLFKDLQLAAGGVFDDVNGKQEPQSYGDVGFEYQAVKTGVGIVNRSGRGKLRLTGKDRTRFLHGMVTNTVEGVAEMAGNHAALTNAQGQTLLDLWVHHLGDYLWLETESGFQQKLYETLDRYLIADDVVMVDETDEWAVLGVVGKNAVEHIEAVLGCDVADLSEHHTVMGEWSGQTVWVTRRSFLGVMGFDIRILADCGGDLWQVLVGAGAVPVGLQAQEVLRVEAGVPRCGLEIDESVAPLEAGLEDTVNFDKGCYIGQEVIAKMHFRGKPRRYLVGVQIEGDQVFELGEDVLVGDKGVGRVTSCVHSMALDKVIALAIVRRGMHEVGQQVRVKNVDGQIVVLPFVAVE